GQTSSVDVECLLGDGAVGDAPDAYLGLALERHYPVAPARVMGEVDVGLRRLRGAARMRVVDADLEAVVVQLVDGEQAAVVELVAVGRVALVDGPEDLLYDSVAGTEVPAALV